MIQKQRHALSRSQSLLLRFSKGIFLVLTSNHWASRLALSLPNILVAIALLNMLTICEFAAGQEQEEMVEDFEVLADETPPASPWYHRLWYNHDGSLRYKTRLTSSLCERQYRLPTNPPVSAPTFGYHQTCWKQIPSIPRCSPCETPAYSSGPFHTGPLPQVIETNSPPGDTRTSPSSSNVDPNYPSSSAQRSFLIRERSSIRSTQALSSPYNK